jgi:hypothetical protein
MGARKAKICEYPIAHELGDETVIARDHERPFIFQTDFDRRVTSGALDEKRPARATTAGLK